MRRIFMSKYPSDYQRVLAIKLFTAWVIYAISLITIWFAQNHPLAVDRIFRPFSKSIIFSLNTVTSQLPFSLAELLLIVATIYIFTTAIIYIKNVKTLLAWLSSKFVTLSVLYFVFLLIWGLNYYATPLVVRLNLSSDTYSADDVLSAAVWTMNNLNIESKNVERSVDGTSNFGGFKTISKDAASGFQKLSQRFTGLPTNLHLSAKPVTAWPLMAYSGISGIYFPFTGEANINPGAPECTLPFTISHEIAHQLGTAPENEANFLSFLACINSDNNAYKYSGWLMAFIYLGNELSPSQFSELWDQLDDDVRKDLIQTQLYEDHYDGFLKKSGNNINDIYLKSMDEKKGIKSYNDVTQLLIAAYKQIGF